MGTFIFPSIVTVNDLFSPTEENDKTFGVTWIANRDGAITEALYIDEAFPTFVTVL